MFKMRDLTKSQEHVSRGSPKVAGVLHNIYIFFFFQAEDGIRDLTVTGVQTCALPISRGTPWRPARNSRKPSGQWYQTYASETLASAVEGSVSHLCVSISSPTAVSERLDRKSVV